MAVCIVSPRAEQDIDAIAEFLARDSVDTALRFYDAVWRTFDGLAAVPAKGRPREAANPALAGLRSWRVEGFAVLLVFYVPQEDGIRVLRVMHGARDIDAELREQSLQ